MQKMPQVSYLWEELCKVVLHESFIVHTIFMERIYEKEYIYHFFVIDYESYHNLQVYCLGMFDIIYNLQNPSL